VSPRATRPRVIRAIEVGLQVEIREVQRPDGITWDVLVADGRKMGSGTGRKMILISHWYTQAQAFQAASYI